LLLDLIYTIARPLQDAGMLLHVVIALACLIIAVIAFYKVNTSLLEDDHSNASHDYTCMSVLEAIIICFIVNSINALWRRLLFYPTAALNVFLIILGYGAIVWIGGICMTSPLT
jgi:hypothetical protein